MTTTAAVAEKAATRVSSGLLRYVLVRMAAAAAVLFAVSVLVFLFIHLAPGGPEYAIAGDSATPEQLDNIRELYGLNDSLLSQYAQYGSSLLQLDFGESFSRRTPVLTTIGDAAMITGPLMVMTWVLSMTVGVTLAIITAGRPGGWLDRVVLGATTVGASAPGFAVGTLFAYVFGIQLGWFPAVGAGDGGLDRIYHLVLPATTVSVVLLATCTKFSRVRIGQIMEEDQMTFARARGLSRGWVLRNVVLRNAGVQLVTLSGGLLIALVAGMIIAEQIFGLPGIGSLMLEAIRERDIKVVQAVTLLVALFVVVINLAVDLVCVIIDPRLRVAMKGVS